MFLQSEERFQYFSGNKSLIYVQKLILFSKKFNFFIFGRNIYGIYVFKQKFKRENH